MPLIEIKSAKITDKGQIAIPKHLRKASGFRKGSKVVILTFEDHIELRPMSQVSRKMATALASEKSLVRDWSSKEENEAWKGL